jgi:ribosomal protein L11 methyltransferase
MRWSAIAINTPSTQTEETVTQLLITAGCGGVALNGEGANRQVTSYLPADEMSDQRLRQLKAAISMLPSLGINDAGEPAISEIDEEDWANSWKAYFKPIRIGRNIVVSPPWEQAFVGQNDHLITIDPGMAFGTGTHATTQMCLVFLEDYIHAGDAVADIGTGSGILSIAAQKLGAGPTTAVDIDPLAVKIARENAAINESAVVVQADFPYGLSFEVVVANIVADTLIEISDLLASITKSDGLLIVSGVIEGRQDDVRFKIEASGFTQLETRSQGEWIATAFRRTLA